MISRRIQVFGKVQGVFFRASTKEKAERLELTGWVKNESDGSVLIEVTGEQENVDELEKWCSTGPMYAKVNRVESVDIEYVEFVGFLITTTEI